MYSIRFLISSGSFMLHKNIEKIPEEHMLLKVGIYMVP